MSAFGKPSIITSVGIRETADIVLTAQEWQVVTFHKNTSGTLVIGTRSEIAATSNGGGIALVTGQPFRLLLGPGTIVYAIGSTPNEALSFHVQYLDMIPLVVDALLNMSAAKAPGAQAPAQAFLYPGQAAFKAALTKKNGG